MIERFCALLPDDHLYITMSIAFALIITYSHKVAFMHNDLPDANLFDELNTYLR